MKKRAFLLFFLGLIAAHFLLLPGPALAQGPASLTVMNPKAEVKEIAEIPVSQRLASLEGKRIGLINNTKLGAKLLQPELEKALQEAVPNIQLKSWVISHVTYEKKDKDLKEAAKASDGIILFLGD